MTRNVLAQLMKENKQDLMALQELDAEHFTDRSAFLLFHFYQVVHNC